MRRVLARAVGGRAEPARSLTADEQRLAESLLPEEPAVAARWAVAAMELGALVCTARAPACDACPVADRCAWLVAGRPPHDGPPRPRQAFEGTDRQARGRLMSVLRDTRDPVAPAELEVAWPEPVQRERALAGLLADGLVDEVAGGYELPR